MCEGIDGISWMAKQLSERLEPERPRSHNPRPPGVIRPGSGTDVLLSYLRRNPGRWFFHSELVLALGRSKGEVDWAIQFLKELGHISGRATELPGRKPVMRYALEPKT